jgi:GldL N-terminal domain/GldM N-terminal domain
MKFANAIIGTFITFILMMGVLFKTMHWPGAGPMIVLGATFLSLYLILVAIGNILSYKKKVLIGICNGIGAFGGMILAVGLLFKIMHWPGAGVMIMVGMFFSVIVFVLFAVLFMISKEPIKLSPGTFFATICFGILLYGVSVGGSSKATLDGIVNSSNATERNILLMANQNDIFAASINSGNRDIYREAHKLYDYIQDLKSELYSQVDGLPKETSDTISLNYIMGKDNYDIPSHIMGIADPGNPVKVSGMEKFSAITLREHIEEFNKTLLELNSDTHSLFNAEPINIEPTYNDDGNLDSWETTTFYHYSLAQVILNLNQINLEALTKSSFLLSQPKQLSQTEVIHNGK